MNERGALLEASDETIENAVLRADPMVLRGVLYMLTRDEELVEMDLVNSSDADMSVQGVQKSSDIALLQSKAANYLRSYRDGGADEPKLGSRDHILRSLSLTAGYDIPDAERNIWIELAAFDRFARGIEWKNEPASEKIRDFSVVVIGTGVSGLNAAVHLKRAGIPFVVIEKNPDVGGTWYENRYPGARVDTASRGYSHQFGVKYPFPDAYCPRDAQLKYFRWVADEFSLRDNIVFNTEVKSMAWDEERKSWEVAAEGPDGKCSWRANAVICCVGFLSRPKLPEIEGMDSFEGVACHTAQWPEGLDLSGKRVAVIGSGASGYQTLPIIAKQVAQTHFFQRTPSWCFEDANYTKPVPPELLWLETNLPYYVNFSRFRLAALRDPDAFKQKSQIDPEFDDPHAFSAFNKAARDERIAYIRKQLADKPELIERMIPPAPPMSSRPIRIDPEENVYSALLRDDVTLVSDAIERITSAGIRAGGIEYSFDIIVYATGFKANDFLWPMDIVGRDGVGIKELWAKDGPRAYLGAMLPGFPNLWMSYGPNSNNFGGFQVIDLLELVTQFALRCIAGLIEHDYQSVEVSREAYWRFAQELDRVEKLMIYRDPRVSNYYKNEHGRSAVNGPIDIRRMWRWLNAPASPPPIEPDAGIVPHFGEDLVVK
jgi:4-hydroxyacetophenone monooxygenase